MGTKGMRLAPRTPNFADAKEAPLTEKQLETIRAILRLSSEKQFPPTLDELGAVFGIDRTAVNHRIVTLLGKGCVTRTGGPRTIVVTEKGRAAVGQPRV